MGDDADQVFESVMVVLGRGDRIVALTDTHADAVQALTSVLVDAPVADSREALRKVLGDLDPIPTDGAETSDVSATVITRTTVGHAG